MSIQDAAKKIALQIRHTTADPERCLHTCTLSYIKVHPLRENRTAIGSVAGDG